MSDKSRDKLYERNVRDIVFHLPAAYRRFLTFGVTHEINSKREIYYSTVFALSSAAVAFLSQFAEPGFNYDWLYIATMVSLGLVIVLVIVIHFLQIIYMMLARYYDSTSSGRDMAVVLESKAKNDLNTQQAAVDGINLMSFIAILDLVLISILLLAVCGYITYLLLNTVSF